MVLEDLGGFRKVREVNWKTFLLFSSRSDLMVPSYDQKTILKRDFKGVRGVIVFEVFCRLFVVFEVFPLRPGSTVHCIYCFSFPKTLTKNLNKNLAKHLLKFLAKKMSDKLTENSPKNRLKTLKQRKK